MIQFLYERKPFSQYRGWAGALGTGLGTALGVKLARPQRVVVCILGDGAWHYNPVPAALGFAQEYGVPLLIVLCNNRQHASQTRNLLKYYPEGAAVRDGNSVGNVIQPTPDYVKQAEAYEPADPQRAPIAGCRGASVTGPRGSPYRALRQSAKRGRREDAPTGRRAR